MDCSGQGPPKPKMQFIPIPNSASNSHAVWTSAPWTSELSCTTVIAGCSSRQTFP